MSGEPQKVYPHGYIAMGNGDLVQATDFEFSATNDGKQVATLRDPQSGVVYGPVKNTVSFNASIDENGAERDYFDLLTSGEIKQLRMKFPGETFTMNGIVKDFKYSSPIDSEIKVSITMVGKVTKS